jgi:hypothetical protein
MLDRLARLFQLTREGDGKLPFHYSVANIVRADGVQCVPHEHVEGAPPPYVIISDASSGNELDSMDKADRDRALANQSEADIICVNPSLLDGWFDDFIAVEEQKPSAVKKYGFQIRMTPSGSMLKRIFFDFILHFINSLPHDQGPKGRGIYLFSTGTAPESAHRL